MFRYARCAFIVSWLALWVIACGAQAPSAEPAPAGALAIVNGKAITEQDLGIEGELLQLRQKEYEIREAALQESIDSQLLQEEAARRGVGVEALLQTEITAKVEDPDNEAIEALYEQQKHRIRQPLEAVRPQIFDALRSVQERRLREGLIASLREKGAVEVLLSPIRFPVDLSEAPLRGDKDAAITIVEFSDFQCPFCKKVQPALQQLRDKYGDEIRWSFKDLPLISIHSGAQKAAEAARCAGDQGKFWEYRDKLFDAEKVTLDMHQSAATELGLDVAEFQKCLASDKYRAGVEADSAEAQKLGISGTPAFLINGIMLSGARPYEDFERVVEKELALAKK